MILNHVPFFLCYLLVLLFGPCTAFLEVGVSSYLGSTVHHMADVGWTLVKPWSVTSRKGFFEATASRGKGFSDSFVTPEPAIYFVALNLHMVITSDGLLRATLVINSEFHKTNGISGVYGITTLEKTLSLSGFLRLYENDVLALYLHGSTGTLLRDSTFSIAQISRIGSVPGFHAVLSSDLAIQPQKKTRLESWRTSGTKGLFSMHSGASPSVGSFCATLEGIHLFAANINVESNKQLTRCHLAIVLNSKTTLVQKHSSGEMNYSTGVSAMFYLNRGDCVDLRVESINTGNLTVQSGSSYSGLFLGIKRETAPQFSVSLHADNQVGMSVGWNRVENWSISSSRRNFQSQDMILKTTHSTFHSSTGGIFLVSALVKTNVSYSLNKSSEHLLVAINDVPNGLTGNSGISARQTLSSGPSSLSVSGVVWLEKGDILTVYIYNDVHDRKIIDGFLGISLVSYDWPGVAATLKESTPLNSQGWTKVTSWKTYNVSGLFSFDNRFFSTRGVYRTHLDGNYFVSCNVIFMGYARGHLSVIIAIDDIIDTGNGLFSLNENPKRYTTLNVAGSIKLRKGQNISVYVATTESSSWSISMQTGFSLVLVGAETLSTPGFFAVKEEEARPSSFCGEIDRWKTMAPPFHSFCQNTALFNATSGRFKAKEDGFYLISANVLIQHLGLSQISMTILLDGQSSKAPLNTFEPKPSNSPSGAFVSTLTLVGTVRLVAEQYLSIFVEVQCQSVSSWKVLGNSSFSVVMVARWESDYAAGFLAKTHLIDNGQSRFNKVYYWKSVFSKTLSASTASSVDIKSSGLYFIQSVLILNDPLGNATFHSGVCIPRTTIAFNGITASKVGEGLKGNFVISAFGVIYLRKGQKIDLCTRSENKGGGYRILSGSLFSMVRFLAPGQRPGLHQTFQHVRSASVFCERSVIRSVSTAGNQLSYINGNIFNPNPTLPCDKGDFTATLTGTYLISLLFTLKGNVSENVTACVGPRKCAECYVEVFSSLNQQNNTVGLTGLLDLKKSELMSICLKSQDNSFFLLSATRSVQFLSELDLNKTIKLRHRSLSLGSSGWHELLEWKTPSDETLQNISVVHSGLYVLSTNMVLKVAFEGLVGVRLKAIGSTHQEILSISSSAKTDSSVSFSVAVLVRLNRSEAISVSVYSNSNSTFFGNNSTFFANLITDDNKHPCLSLRSKTSRYSGGKWWKGIEQWEDVDTRCLSPNSEFAKGRFVTDITGVYFAAAVVIVSTSSSLHQTRIIELLLSVNGDSVNTNGLKATKAVAAGSSVVLSLSATVYLEPWQTLYLMIRSSGAGTVEVVNGSTFSVALIDGTKYYKTVTKNVTHFDNGPRVIRHPPPSVSLGDGLGLNISWTCDAVAKDVVKYKWLKNDETITSSYNLSLTNVQVSHSGRYVCLAEYDGIKVFSQAAKLDVFDTRPQFESKKFTASEDSNVFIELMFSALNKQRMPANVSLVIVKGNTNDTFVLSRVASKENVYLRNQISFDYETTKLYQLTLTATNQDTKKTTSANIMVVITDVNDNPPIFTSRTNNVSVEENVANGTAIFQVKATDADYGNNSIITYSLLPSENGEKFAINAVSGNITVVGNLDRENTSEVTLRIQATDGKFLITTKLFITLLDVNEFPPVFDRQSYKKRISEKALVGEPVIQVLATDKDSGENSRLFYNIISGNSDSTFSVNAKNGAIVLQKPLDYKMKKDYELRVKATDNGIPSLESFTKVSITVEEECEIIVTLQEPPHSTTQQLFRVPASSDVKYGSNANITYSIVIENNAEVCNDLVIDHDGGVYGKRRLPWGAICNITARATDVFGTYVCLVYLRVVAITTPGTEHRTAVPSVPAKVDKDVIYGPVIGVLASILISVIIYFIIKTQRRQRVDRQYENPDEIIRRFHFNMGIEDERNNENFGPRDYMELGDVAQSQEEVTGTETSPYLEIHDYAPLHPSTRSWEVPRENVVIEKVIGQGAFGQVAQGTASQLRGREGTTTVAIKMLKARAHESDRKDLLSELEVMKTLKPHAHVIKLLGCVTASGNGNGIIL